MTFLILFLLCYGEIPGVPGPPNPAEQLHSADQAAIVKEGAAVTSKPTEVLGKVGTVSLRKKSYQCIQTIEVPCAQYTPCKASVHDNHIMAMMIISIISIRIQR